MAPSAGWWPRPAPPIPNPWRNALRDDSARDKGPTAVAALRKLAADDGGAGAQPAEGLGCWRSG